jgi:HEAT repeat protein
VKRDPVRAALDALAAAARHPRDPATSELVREALASRSHLVVARAARAAREGALPALAPELARAFPRFLRDPIRRDQGCAAKTEIARALLAFAYPAPDVYLTGARHVQREPAFGEPIDTAVELRGICAMALVTTEHPAALAVCVDLLVDREPDARAGALRALGVSGRADMALVVRLFVLRGESEPSVLAEAFASLIRLAADEDSVGFVAAQLAAASDDTARAAAAALGEAHRSDAVRALRERLPQEDRDGVRHALILALATSHDDGALDVLVDLVTHGSAADSRAALDAARLYPHDEALQRRIADAQGSRRPVGRRRLRT